ncbi:UNVERIFIED_ORG: hypothetical protein J3D58_004153 [Paenarthrobacter nicotinovorans]
MEGCVLLIAHQLIIQVASAQKGFFAALSMNLT